MVEEYIQQVKRLARLALYALALLVLGWGFSSNPPFFAGMMLGLSLGLLSLLHVAYKVHRLGESIVQGRGRTGLGMATRLSLGALGAVVTLQFPEQLSLLGMVIGFFIPSVLALGDAIYLSSKK